MSEPLHRRLGMTDDEHDRVVEILGREPNSAELAMYSVMWSEHCSYKSSRKHLRHLPTEAEWVVVGPGENAGVVDLGDGWCAAIRIESHNHPSFVEPYQGAATGVGGIIRDVLTMGARPVALWDQIRTGPIDEPRQRYLFGGIVAGIAGYGNAVGVPTVGGEVEFDDAYAANPLVNVACLGVMRREQLVLATAGEPGNVAILLGGATGRDGIGGASVLASASFQEADATKRPAVQVGDPFMEKKVIEACLDLFDRGLVSGIQDLGAAGLSCAASEPVGKAGLGMHLDLDAVPTREPGMTAGELLMSESQERMMAFVRPEDVDEVLRVAGKWEIAATVVGTVTDGDRLVVTHEGDVVADVPAASLDDEAPILDRRAARPAWQDELNAVETTPPRDQGAALLELLAEPDVGDARWVWEQYDHMLFGDTVVGPGADASLLRIRGTDKGIAVSTDGNGRLCLLDPRGGSERLVYEAALNVACVGATPLALVDNLNFGDPTDPGVMWQFTESVAGLAAGCEALGLPVVGGNVSFYNSSGEDHIHPTPVVGVLGSTEPLPPPLPRPGPGMALIRLGPEQSPTLAGSAFQRMRGELGGMPSPADARLAQRLTPLVARLAHGGHRCHDISRGGLAASLGDVLLPHRLGASLLVGSGYELFGEDPHRVLVVTDRPDDVLRDAEASGVEALVVGEIGGDAIAWRGTSVAVEEAASAWGGGLADRMASR